jgi:glutamyl-Q tRNA(Asp) synthetase
MILLDLPMLHAHIPEVNFTVIRLVDNMNPDPAPILRFAPSPNGLLHLGHAYSALLNLQMARALGGEILLRIEDIDIERCTPELESRMLRDLEWIGFEWDAEPVRQSQHLEQYRDVLHILLAENLVYPAMLSRRQIRQRIEQHTALGKSWPCDPEGVPLYPGDERDLEAAERQAIIEGEFPYALRLDMQSALASVKRPIFWPETGSGPDGETGEIAANPAKWGDVILGRKLVPASYHLSCVLDDHNQGITHIVRGRDLFHATAVHRLLQEILHLDVPLYHHHELILDETGWKLSKSNSSTAICQLREAGLTPFDIRRMVGL